MENTTIAKSSKRALAIVAVLCMISAAFVGVAFAYTATYTDTIEETSIDTEYILVTGGDMKYLGETITVNLNTATTPDKDSDGSYVTADGDYKNTTVYTFSSVNGNVDAQGNIDIELGNVKITNVSPHPKTIYFGHEVGTRTVTTGSTSILDDTSLSFVYLRTTDLMDGTTVVQAAGTPVTYADFGATGEANNDLTLSVHMKGKVSTAAITSAVNNATTALPSFVLPSFTLTFIADAGSTVVSTVTPGVPFEAQVVNNETGVSTAIEFDGNDAIIASVSPEVSVTEVLPEAVEAVSTYSAYASGFLGGISVVAKNPGATENIENFMSTKTVNITLSNIDAADAPNITVFHGTTKVIENSASIVSGVTVGTNAYNATDKTFTFTTTLGFSTYVAFAAVAKVVKAGEITNYGSLQAASLAAVEGSTITLLKDLSVTQSDLASFKDYWDDTEYAIVAPLDGVNFDGNGKTITCSFNDYCLFGDVRNAKISNLTVYFDNCINSGMVYYTENATLEQCTVEGKIKWTSGNQAAFVDYPRYDLTLDTCVNEAELYSESGDTTIYCAVFLGYGFPTENTYVLKNCSNTGSLSVGKAGLLIANWSYGSPAGEHHFTLDVQNTYNNGTITSSSNDSDNNMVTSITQINEKDYAVYIKIDGATYNKSSEVKWYSDTVLNLITGVNGSFTKQVDSTLCLIMGADKSFTITPAANASVAKYVISVGTYVGTENGSSRYYVTETIDKDNLSTIAIKGYSFVDKTWANGKTADADKLCGNTTYTVSGDTYYLVEDSNYFFSGHAIHAPEMISVSALGANGELIASYQLTI